jgi:LacI family transcriptional regulator
VRIEVADQGRLINLPRSTSNDHENTMKRITLRDIAKNADVSVMAVSLALRDAGRLKPKTRERIKSMAKAMGYVPDPALSALVYHRNEKQTVSDFSTLAFLTNFLSRDSWNDEVYINAYFNGATHRAAKIGYVVEPIWMREPGMTPSRMGQILETRGIKGILVAPVQEKTGRVDLDWDRFCAVSLCRNLVQPKINVVDHNHHLSMHTAWQELMSRGYRKVGYAIKGYSEAMTGNAWWAQLLMEQTLRAEAGAEAIPPLVSESWNKEAFEKWFRIHRPDVVISPDILAFSWLKQLVNHVPGDVGFLHLEAEPNGQCSGVCQDFSNIGATAVDLLHLEIMRAERGIPSVRQSIGIDGYWVEGSTLRPKIGDR